MQIRKILAASAAALVLAGCKVEITVPEGGRVMTLSGNEVFNSSGEMLSVCETGMTCSVDVVDIFFDETFTTEADEGMTFGGWEKLNRGLCGGSMDDCRLFTEGFEGNEVMMGFLENDEEIFFMNPTFVVGNGSAGSDPICEYEQNAGPFSYDVCHTEQTESSCQGTYAGTFSTGSCTEGRDPGPAGYCTVPDGDIYYYDHGQSSNNYELGCGFINGEWTDLR